MFLIYFELKNTVIKFFQDTLFETICNDCKKAMSDLECAEAGKLTRNVTNIYKPITCIMCKLRFPDEFCLKSHAT